MKKVYFLLRSCTLLICFVLTSKYASAQPPNDDCANAVLLVPASSCVTTNGTNVLATQSIAPLTCNAFTSSSALDVWYKFVAAAPSQTITVVGGATLDAIVDLRSGACNGTNIACADATVSGGTETINAAGLSTGTTYYIRVYGWAGGTGTFTICVTTPSAITNDDCSTAITINCGQTINATTSGATIDAVGTCVTALNTAPGVWYTFVGDGLVNTLSLCGSGYDTKIGIFTGTCGSLVCVTGNDDFCGLQSSASTPTVLGTTYYVLVTGFGANSGAFTLNRTCLPAIPNDVCSGAININCAQTINGTTVGASIDAVATCGTTLNTAPGIWYTFTGNGADITLSLCGSGYDTKIGVFSGSCGSLTCVAGNDDFCGLQSQVSFPSVFGTQYYVLVTGFGTATGTFSLTRTCIFPNEACTGAIDIACGQTINGTTVGATADAVSSCVTTLNTAPGLWYKFTGDGSPVTMSLCGSAYDTKIGVFSGSCGSLTCVTGNDDACGTGGTRSQVTFPTVFGTVYYVLVTGFSTNAGVFALQRTCVPDCSGAPTAGTITGPAIPACAGANVLLSLSGNSVGPGIAYQWSSSATSGGPYTAIPGANAPTYSFVATNTIYYVATVTCTKPGGTSVTTSQFTVLVSKPVHSAVSYTIVNACSNGSITVTGTVSGSASPGNYTHTLTGPGTISAPVVSGPNNSTVVFTVSNLPAGTYSYTLTSTDPGGCSVSSVLSGIVIKPTPVITITQTPSVICSGDVQTISASVAPPDQVTFTQPATTIIQDNTIANPYPSQIAVAGLPTSGVTVKSVKLGNFNHTFPDDVDIVLVSPSGQAVILMSDVGGSDDAIGLDYTLDDAAASMADATFNPTGTYKPTNFGSGDNWPSPGPGTSPTSVALSSFSGDPNGNWKLYIVDDLGGDFGFLGNWSITFNNPTLVVFNPITNLYTNPGATTAYLGQPISVVYAKPPSTSNYTATATLNGCSSVVPITVNVNQPPVITAQPSPATQTVCPGFNVVYTVVATGTGLTYQWKQNGVNLVDGGFISGATTNTLTLSTVTTANSGTYTVVVSGTCPPAVTSNGVVLNVATAPVISTQPPNTTVCQGSSASISVATVGSIPPPTIFQWQLSTDGGATYNNVPVGAPYFGIFTSTLTINPAATTMNNYRFRVIVTNSCGQTTTTNGAILTVNPLPTVTATALASRICISDTLIPLVGSPVGGNWSGVGVSGFNFVPPSTAVGTYNLTYTYTSAVGCTNTATVVAKVEDCQERLRLLSDDGVILYPNPNNGRFNIRINSTLYNYLGMKVYNANGQLLTGKIVNDIMVSPVYSGLVYGRVIPIDLSKLPQGIYMVKFYYDDGVRTSEKAFKVIIGAH